MRRNSIRTFIAAMAIVSISAFVFAQQRGGRGGRGGAGAAAPAPTDTTNATQMTAAELNAAIAKVGNDRPNASVRVFSIAPYTVNVEHRTNQTQTASVHEAEAELFYVIDGSVTFVTGGKLVGETRTGTNLSGTSIEGGTPHKLNKGDFLIVPAGVPHWFSQYDTPSTNIMSLHLPMPK
jgi:quercetin dioxygenase-like cupin family protein